MNLLFPIALLLVNWSIDSTDPEVRQAITYLFILVHVILFAVAIYLFGRILVRNDTRALQVTDSYSNEVQQMTVADYDFSKWRALFFMKLLLPLVVGQFVASRWETPFPLLLQCAMNPVTMFRSPLFQLHVLERREEGDFVRPWKEESAVPAWLQQMWDTFQANESATNSGSPTLKNKRRRL
ncbi:uncharacterized protein Tco025E_02732 [Trypanosoma conorhini]|uniref:Uncharacterized protein n=1 Tax=Trypanosoma conorhini TaxID=83891 RepID=A0A422Q1B1_9TRYP|nr:uncharacterized protein Tco025E_02732 [Trypanosoma conorhini]RNF23772.1 hypothetical protein Tco025E_02732 [Trypanosoma conorhini]